MLNLQKLLGGCLDFMHDEGLDVLNDDLEKPKMMLGKKGWGFVGDILRAIC